MKKKMTKVLALVLALVMVCALATTAHATNSGWTWRQETVHQIAELARSLGLPENHPIIMIAQDLWWADNDGKDPNSIGSYHSNRTGQTSGYDSGYTSYNANGYRGNTITENGYTWTWDASTSQYYRWQNGNKIWLNTGTGTGNNYTSNGISFKWNGYQWYQIYDGSFYRWNGRNVVWASNSEIDKILKNGTYLGRDYYDTYAAVDSGRSTSTNTNSTYWDGQYTWYWDTSASRYYRVENGTKIWWGQQPSQQPSQPSQQPSQPVYNSNLFSGYNWYNGLIAGPNDDWVENQARILVRIAQPYITGIKSQTAQAQFMWVAVNIANGGDLANVVNCFPKYNANNNTTLDDYNRNLLALARDVLFRYKAEQNGWTMNGRVLPAQYTYFSISGQNITFTDANGNVYNGNLRSPYEN